MSSPIYAIQSTDGNLELALCPATIELRLSTKTAREFDAACEVENPAVGSHSYGRSSLASLVRLGIWRIILATRW